MEENTCTVCFKIVCRECKWEPSEEEVVAIQSGKLTACPQCGWIPGT